MRTLRFVVFALTCAPLTHSITLSSATSDVFIQVCGSLMACNDSNDTYDSGGPFAASGSLDFPWSVDLGGGISASLQGVGHGWVTFGSSPEADVAGSAYSSDPGNWAAGSVQVTVQSWINFSVAIASVQPTTPSMGDIAGLPVTMTARGEAQNGDAYINVDGTTMFDTGYWNGSFSGTVPLSWQEGQENSVYMYAICQAGTGDAGPVTSCHSLVDPVFSFDQPTFDSEMAAQSLPSFNLSDYFEIQESSNLSDVPEPGGLALIGLGAVLLYRRTAACWAS